MKKRQLIAIFSALVMSASVFTLVACNDLSQSSSGSEDPGPDSSSVIEEPELVFGLPKAERGRYINNSDLIVDGETRYLVYTTNLTAGEEDSVIAVRSATVQSDDETTDWVYGEEVVAIQSGAAGAWDAYIDSASIVKGSFKYEGVDYGWLIAYNATSAANNTGYQIGLAVATSPVGEWVKVGSAPVVTFSATALGESATSLGCYAPSLVNYTKASGIRLFYTYADSKGHFAKFVDFDATDLSALVLGGDAFVPNNGQIDGGDSVAMFPNADFAYDSENSAFYAIKDYSPTPTAKPQVARKIQLLSIAEDELYTTDIGAGWVSLASWDSTDTEDMYWERLYGGSIVSDAYGHVIDAAEMEIVYNVSDIVANTDDYIFTQNLATFIYSAPVVAE